MYILSALAMALVAMTVLRPCALKNSVSLLRGLAVSLVMALVQMLMAGVGMWVGYLLCFDPDDPLTGSANARYNELVFIGLVAVVAIKLLSMVWRKKSKLPAYDISRWSTAIAMSLAQGINLFLLGMAWGFLRPPSWTPCVAVLVLTFLLSYWGIMLGRSATAIRERRWVLLAVVILLAVSLFQVL